MMQTTMAAILLGFIASSAVVALPAGIQAGPDHLDRVQRRGASSSAQRSGGDKSEDRPSLREIMREPGWAWRIASLTPTGRELVKEAKIAQQERDEARRRAFEAGYSPDPRAGGTSVRA